MSDAAPLPRLGEVFFDVRGNSRSMRLSWYADTGVAVFSIWQAGMCTGTFRLPIGDLSRMIEILQRGPARQSRGPAPVSGARRGPDRGRGEYPAEDEISLLDSTSGAGGYAGADYGRPGRGTDYPPADYRSAGDYGPAADYGSAGYAADYQQAGYEPAGYEPPGYADASQGGAGYGYGGPGQHRDDREAGPGGGPHRSDDYLPEGGFRGDERLGAADYGSAGYQPADYGAGHADDDTSRRPGHASTGSYPGGPDYRNADHQPAFPAGGRRGDDGRFRSDTGGLSSAETDGTGHLEERFVPPYVQGGAESHRNDIRADGSDFAGDQDDARYPPVDPPVHESLRSGEAYSYGADYRRR